MKKRYVPLIAIGALILIIVLIIVFGLILGRERPSTEVMDLSTYFKLGDKDQVVVFIDDVRHDVDVSRNGGRYYLPISTAKELNDRIYWDYNENLMIYITNEKVLKFNPGETSYFEDNNKKEAAYQAVIVEQDEPYIALDFIEDYTATVRHEEAALPTRLLITSKWGFDKEYVIVKNDNKIRNEYSIKSPILVDAIPGDKLIYLGSHEDWAQVQTLDGVCGFIETKHLEEPFKENTLPPTDGYKESFSHVFEDGKINMLWHQVWSESVNSEVHGVLTTSTGVNVLSPTWFVLDDDKGNFKSRADIAYVDTCHNAGVKVWATFNNFEKNDVDSEHILTHTSIRENMENQIVMQALNYKLDGVNIDFELLKSSVDDAYVQFIRELALKCHANGLVLSVDNLVPMEYSAFYRRGQQAQFADYICLMAYDEHYNGSEAGSVSSLEFVRNGVKNTIADGVPKEQLIVGLPFYTRIWFERDTGEGMIETTSETASMADARKYAEQNGADFVWDDELGQYYCQYTKDDGALRRIWIEDAKSIREKMRVMQDNNLAGAAFWKAGLETSDVWGVINEFY